MNIEIVEFYIIEKNDKKKTLLGTVHIFIVDEGIDLRGIFVKLFNNKWIIHLPGRKAIDSDTGEEVRYPVFSYLDQEKNKKLINAIREKAIEYVKENVLEIS